MKSTQHLWAVGYEDMVRASQVRDEIVKLGWVENRLILTDLAVVVRHLDGSFTLDRERFPTGSNIVGCSAVGFLAGLVLGVPVVGAAIGAMVGGAGTAMSVMSAGIADDFVKDAQRLMKPGTSAIFVLDCEGDMDVILHGIRGLGGTVLKTNVDVERARLIQSALKASQCE
jgi:uncharacterized membrane protein